MNSSSPSTSSSVVLVEPKDQIDKKTIAVILEEYQSKKTFELDLHDYEISGDDAKTIANVIGFCGRLILLNLANAKISMQSLALILEAVRTVARPINIVLPEGERKAASPVVNGFNEKTEKILIKDAKDSLDQKQDGSTLGLVHLNLSGLSLNEGIDPSNRHWMIVRDILTSTKNTIRVLILRDCHLGDLGISQLGELMEGIHDQLLEVDFDNNTDNPYFPHSQILIQTLVLLNRKKFIELLQVLPILLPAFRIPAGCGRIVISYLAHPFSLPLSPIPYTYESCLNASKKWSSRWARSFEEWVEEYIYPSIELVDGLDFKFCCAIVDTSSSRILQQLRQHRISSLCDTFSNEPEKMEMLIRYVCQSKAFDETSARLKSVKEEGELLTFIYKGLSQAVPSPATQKTPARPRSVSFSLLPLEAKDSKQQRRRRSSPALFDLTIRKSSEDAKAVVKSPRL